MFIETEFFALGFLPRVPSVTWRYTDDIRRITKITVNSDCNCDCDWEIGTVNLQTNKYN
jgi:hypothetical protein